jgi:hypothetical protein
MVVAALFTITKPWNQPRLPSTGEWIKKMWYVSTMEYYSVIKKKIVLCRKLDEIVDHHVK